MESRGFYYPVDIALAEDGRIYGLNRSHEGDARGVRVCVLDLESEFYGVFGSIGDGDGQFVWATSIAIDSEGMVYVSDEFLQRISIFDASGNFLGKWGTYGSKKGELDGPSGLAFDKEDNLYIVDHRNHRVQKFTKDGQFLSTFGSHGQREGQFNLPWGINIDVYGDVWIADWRNDRVQRFSSEGTFIKKYGGFGSADGELCRPSSVAADEEGCIYIADWGNERVQILDPDGGFITNLRGEATVSKWGEDFLRANVDEADARAKSDLEPDTKILDPDPHEQSSHIEKLFWGPSSVRLDLAGRVYVVDRNRHRIQVYQKS